MKSISIRQPWASLIAAGIKNVENRTWAPRYRGDILIVSSRSRPALADIGRAEKICATIGARVPDEYPLGVALCVVHFGGILHLDDIGNTVTDHPTITEIDGTWWDDGYTGWILEDVRQIDPIPVVGRLGLYDVDLI